MKIGIYGGSFDPIHNGHVNIVKYILDKLSMDLMIVVPAGFAYFKQYKMTLGEIRSKMCKLAFENMPKVKVSDIEIKKEGPSYTYDTLCELISIYGKDNSYYEIIGEDSLCYFQKWKNSNEILELSKLVVLRRKGYKGEVFDKNIMLLDSPYYNISSTEIRTRIGENKDIKEFVPKKVYDYIIKNNLYKNGEK